MHEQLVKKWNKDFGVYLPGKPQFPNPSERDSMVSLIQEEVSEAIEAIRDGNDIQHIAKELADVQFVVAGAIARLGLTELWPQIKLEVYRSNESKKQLDGTVLRNESGKILKGECYSPADLSFIPSAQNRF